MLLQEIVKLLLRRGKLTSTKPQASDKVGIAGALAPKPRQLQRGVVLGSHTAEFLVPVLLEQPPHLVGVSIELFSTPSGASVMHTDYTLLHGARIITFSLQPSSRVSSFPAGTRSGTARCRAPPECSALRLAVMTAPISSEASFMAYPYLYPRPFKDRRMRV